MSVFLPHFAFPWVRPWDNRGKCYTDRKRIQCLSNVSQHVPIYLQPFLRYIQLLVENCDIFRPHLCLAAPQGVTPSEFREDLSIQKTRMNGLSCGEEIMTRRSAVLIGCQRVTDGRTDVQPISITCFNIADARKKPFNDTQCGVLAGGEVINSIMVHTSRNLRAIAARRLRTVLLVTRLQHCAQVFHDGEVEAPNRPLQMSVCIAAWTKNVC